MSKNNDGIYMTPEETIAEIEITQEVDKLWLLVEGKKM